MTKLLPLSEAISQHVHDGDTVYAAGFTHLIPFAAGHEIIRQKRQELTLARATPDLIYDQMVAAGCARKVIFSYMGNPGVGSLRVVRAAGTAQAEALAAGPRWLAPRAAAHSIWRWRSAKRARSASL